MKLSVIGLAALAAALASAGALAGNAEDLIVSNKCSKCHTETTTKKAPSWASLAAKYKGDAGSEAKLVELLKTGGADDHKTVKASDTELKAIVKIVLSSK